MELINVADPEKLFPENLQSRPERQTVRLNNLKPSEN
jgi:hypothetical protein